MEGDVITKEEERLDEVTPDYVSRWVDAAKKAAKAHWDTTRAAWAEYDKKSVELTNILENNFADPRPYPIYRSCCKTLEPAYYSRTPKIKSKRRHGAKDSIALTMALINDRLGEYLQAKSDFDFVMHKVVLDFLHGDKACCQVKFEADPAIETQLVEQRNALTEIQDPEGNYFYDAATDSIYEGDVQQDEEGFFYVTQVEEEIPSLKNYRVKLLPLSYDEVLHTPYANCEDAITEKAYYFLLERPEAKKLFPGKKINWKSGNARKKKDEDKDEKGELLTEYVEGWEFYDKRTGKVYWWSDQCPDGFLKVQKDPNQLQGFFPSTKFIISSPPEKDLYPIGIYGQLVSIIEELHALENRIFDLIDKIRRRALVDGAEDELLMALEQLGNGEFVKCQNLQSIIEKGGVDKCVWYIPVKELVDAISELAGLQEKFKAEFYEWFGLPDILRGETDQYETAKAQMLNAGAGQDRFKSNKRLIGGTAREALQMMVDLAYRHFPDELIKQIVGFETLDAAYQANFDVALEKLRDDEVRLVTIDIDTDSMSFIDDELKAKRMHEASTVFIRGLEQVSQMMGNNQKLAIAGLQALLMVLDSMGMSKEFEEKAKEVMDSLMEEAKKPQEPLPDYEGMKLQIKQQEVQIKAQEKQKELMQKDFELQIKAQKMQNDSQIAAAKVQIEQTRLALEDVMQEIMTKLEAQRVANETLTAQVNAQEAMLEEARLAAEVGLREYEIAAQAAVGGGVENAKESSPPAVINVIQQPEPKEKLVPVPVPVDPLEGL